MKLKNLIILYHIIIYYKMNSKDLGINKKDVFTGNELKYLTLRG